MSDNKIKETLKKDRLHFQNKIQIFYTIVRNVYTTYYSFYICVLLYRLPLILISVVNTHKSSPKRTLHQKPLN